MEMDMLQAGAVVDSKDWFGEDKFGRFDLTYFILAMVGEAGEAANKTKKLIRDGHTDQMVDAIKEEIADTFIYCMLAANYLGENLEDLYQRKRHLNVVRFGNVA